MAFVPIDYGVWEETVIAWIRICHQLYKFYVVSSCVWGCWNNSQVSEVQQVHR